MAEVNGGSSAPSGSGGTDQESSGYFAVGALVGAAFGAVIGLLYAPKTGSETRRQLAEKTEETREKILERAEDARDRLQERATEARQQLEEAGEHAREAAKEASETAREVAREAAEHARDAAADVADAVRRPDSGEPTPAEDAATAAGRDADGASSAISSMWSGSRGFFTREPETGTDESRST